MSYQEPFVKVIDTNAIKKPSSPQFIVKNPLAKNIFVNAIILSFDSYFSEKGVVLIKINDNVILNQKTAGTYKRLKTFPISLKNQQLQQQKKIEVFAWNGTDTDFVSLGVDILISEDPNIEVPPDFALSVDQRNLAISDEETLFPETPRTIGTFPILIDMKGYRKLIVTLNKSNPETPISTKDILGWVVNPTDLDKSHDGLLSTVSTDGDVIGAGNFGEVTWEWATQKVRNIQVRGNYAKSDTAVTGTLRIFTSTDGIIFTQRFIDVDFDPIGAKTVDIGSFDLKFVKVEIEVTFNQGSNRIRAKWTEVFDRNEMGGTGSLSFQVKDTKGNWNEFIASSEFGTITDGDASIVEQIGDVITKSISGKTYALPSTQTNFRGLYTVTGNAIHNLVSILKVF